MIELMCPRCKVIIAPKEAIGIACRCDNCSQLWLRQPAHVAFLEAALAERDARIAEWDKEIKRVKTKLELVYCMLDEMKSQYEFCDCSDDSDDDICIGCRLTEILSDMRAEVPSET